MPRRIFPASSVTNATGLPMRLTFHYTQTGGVRASDLWTVDGSNYISAGIPNGVVLTDASGNYSAFAGPDDVDTLYVGANGGSRTAITATGYEASSTLSGTNASKVDPRLRTGRTLPGTPIASNGMAGPTQLVTAADGTSRAPHKIVAAATDIRFIYANYYTSTSHPFLDTTGPNAISINASVEDTSGTIWRITFNGRTTGTVDPGGILISDPLGIDVAAGDTIWSRTYVNTSGASYYANKASYRGSASGGFTATTDLTASGSGAVSTSANYQYVPFAVLGSTATMLPSVGILGDSIVTGIGDGQGSILPGITNAGTDGGWVQRAFYGRLGVVNVGVSGDRAYEFSPNVGHHRRLAMLNGCTHAIEAYGRNDLDQSQTLAQIQANLITIWNALARRGIKVWRATVTPKTTSTDSWATTTNQTVANSTIEAVRVSLNTWIRAGCPISATTGAAVAVGTAGALVAGASGHPLVGIIDAASVVESATNSGIWQANYTTDGLHPSATASAAIAAIVPVSSFTL